MLQSWLFAAAIMGQSLTVGPDDSRITQWFAEVPISQTDESFGDLVVRAAVAQLGKPYIARTEDTAPETLRIDLTGFECVTLVENTLAIARCTYLNQQNIDCFKRELQAFRYRQGIISDVTSRLHYFDDWLRDNEKRGRIQNLTDGLSGKLISQPVFFMTHHPASYPWLEDKSIRQQFYALEKRLSSAQHHFIPKDQLQQAQAALDNGDIVAVITKKPGLLVGHTGFIMHDNQGKQHFLHASSFHQRVLITNSDLATYVKQNSTRTGVMIYRPVPPSRPVLSFR
jgi:hypothetical protein